MNKVKYYLAAMALVLPAFVGLPTYAEPGDELGDELQGGDVVLVGDPDELVGSGDGCDGDECDDELDDGKLRNVDGDFVALSSVTLSSSNVSVAVGEQKFLTVSYNEGFDTANMDEWETTIEFTSGDNDYTAWAYYDGDYEDDQYEVYVHDWNSIYVYGNEIGSATYTVRAVDLAGNEATATITITVIDALGSDYGAVYENDGSVISVSYELGATFGDPIAGGREVKVALVPMTEALQLLDSRLNAVLDVSVVDENGAVIPVSNNDIEMWMGVRKSLLGDLADAETLYFQVVYIENGAIAQYFDTYDVEDDGWGWMFTVSGLSHFSQYGILVSTTPFNSAAEMNALLAPNTGVFTRTSNSTLSTTELMATIAILSTVLAAYGAVRYSKRSR